MNNPLMKDFKMPKNNYIIYKFTSPSGKSYIGQTNDLVKRISAHKRTNGCIAFKSAIDKYGFENFTKEILKENLSVDDANQWEELLIKQHDTLFPNGYNLHSGGRNHTASEITKQKITAALLARPPMPQETKDKMSKSRMGENNAYFGKKHSEETRAKMREAWKNRKPLSEETKEKIVKAVKDANTGKKRPPEVIEKVRLANTGKKRTPETCAKLSECRRNLTDEARKNMSEAAKRRYQKQKHEKTSEVQLCLKFH
jgi:group I intron endonuclease